MPGSEIPERIDDGRPPTLREVSDLIVRLARENGGWGYTRSEGALANLGHRVSRTTVANILGRHGIDPAPERGQRIPWGQFFESHWEVIAAADFFTVEGWGLRGLVTYYVLFVIELSTRRIHFAGATPNPDTAWMMQIARNLTGPVEGFLRNKRFVIMDRDSNYCEAFRTLLEYAGVEPVRLPPR